MTMTRHETDMAEDLFIEIIKAELTKPMGERTLTDDGIRGHAATAMAMARIYYNEAYEVDND